MSTKEKFLKEIKEVCSHYEIRFIYRKAKGVPDGTINNLPNIRIEGFKITIPDEDVRVVISAQQFVEYVCDKTL